jgi:hypothetical protein
MLYVTSPEVDQVVSVKTIKIAIKLNGIVQPHVGARYNFNRPLIFPKEEEILLGIKLPNWLEFELLDDEDDSLMFIQTRVVHQEIVDDVIEAITTILRQREVGFAVIRRSRP